MTDPWQVLGIDPHSDAAAVRARWLELSRALHPDHHGDAASAARLAEINDAYARVRAASPAGVAVPEAAAPPSAAPATATFSVEDFRPAVFDALLDAATDIADVVDAEDPLWLELVWGRRHCRIELVPEAGGSVITVDGDHLDAGALRESLAGALRRRGFEVRPA